MSTRPAAAPRAARAVGERVACFKPRILSETPGGDVPGRGSGKSDVILLFPVTGLFSVRFRLAEGVEGDDVLMFRDPVQFSDLHPGMNFLTLFPKAPVSASRGGAPRPIVLAMC